MQKNITENTCRVCLTEQEILISLFDEVEDFQTKLSDLLECCGDFQVDLSDNYPKLICGDCTSELLVAAKFREKCRRTKEILSQFIPTESVCESDIAEEDPDVEPESPAAIEVSEIEPDTDLKKELTEELENNEEDEVEDSHMDVLAQRVFEQVEFLNTNETEGQYAIIFDEETEDNSEELFVNSRDNEDLQKVEDNHDQILYDRIIKAAKSAAKYTPKHQILTKPLIINCKCDICGAGFTHQNNLRRHLEKHNSLVVYTCSVCYTPFSTYEKFELHENEHKINLAHENNFAEKENTKEEIYTSEESPPSNVKKKLDLVVPRTKGHVVNSRDVSDNKETKRNHICDHCEKRFVSKSALSAHLRIHTGDRPFECTECTKTFTTQGGLVLHMRRHTGLRPFSCNVCGKRFVESSNLKVHMRIHTGEKPHKCTICGRNFARVFLLQIHQRTHTGERPYQCPYCEKAFAQQGDLASHKRIHTGERPHKCPYCSKGFIKSSALTQHMRKHSKFDGTIARKQASTESDFPNSNYDILIVKDEETIHSDEIENNDKEDSKHELGIIVECPGEIVETN